MDYSSDKEKPAGHWAASRHASNADKKLGRQAEKTRIMPLFFHKRARQELARCERRKKTAFLIVGSLDWRKRPPKEVIRVYFLVEA
jgi:phage host-nuclease inhibitor protein Gam